MSLFDQITCVPHIINRIHQKGDWKKIPADASPIIFADSEGAPIRGVKWLPYLCILVSWPQCVDLFYVLIRQWVFLIVSEAEGWSNLYFSVEWFAAFIACIDVEFVATIVHCLIGRVFRVCSRFVHMKTSYARVLAANMLFLSLFPPSWCLLMLLEALAQTSMFEREWQVYVSHRQFAIQRLLRQ